MIFSTYLKVGNLLEGIPNTLGLKIINSLGKGVKGTGAIYDNSDTEVTTFTTNQFGIGKCLFTP